MKRRLFGFLTACVLTFTLTVPSLRAQVVNDGATNTLNNVTNFIAGDVTVGTNGSFTLLVLNNNALLSNSGQGYLGRNAGANSNMVRLASASARWLMSGDLFVGDIGSWNQLVLSNGSVVRNGSGYLGLISTSTNNVAVVTGAGSWWTNQAALYVGGYGAGNQLVVSNGGGVRSSAGYVGFGPFSSSNTAVVTGAGTLWTNESELYVGYEGAGNQLVVSSGGTVSANNGVFVGGYGTASNNFLLLSAGALLTSSYDGILGVRGRSNSAFLSGANTRWLMGGNLHVGSNGALNRLVISDGAWAGNDYGYLGDTISSSNNEAVVTGAGSVWSNRLGLHVGNSGSGNRLVITNGGVARNLNGLLGLNADSSNNVALVTGAGSRWTNEADLFVGVFGAGNRLVITNGGRVDNNSSYLGGDFIDGNNEVLVTGAGSIWSNRSRLDVGLLGSGNRVVITNGGTVFAGTDVWVGDNTDSFNNLVRLSTGALLTNGGNGVIGFRTGANSNTASISGINTRWLMGGDLYLGSNGVGNQMVVTSGGVVRNNTGFLGFTSASSNNVALVTGAGSRWTNVAGLVVGYEGVGNQLVVSNGAVVRNEVGNIGYLSSSNAVKVTGAASRWENRSVLHVGFVGSGNQLVVSNGGVVTNSYAEVGNDDSSNNTVVVTGAGSRWEQDSLDVGSGGSGNQLLVSDGGVVRDDVASIGAGFDLGASSSNVAVVTGAGSLWTNGSFLVVGDKGAGNQLVVSNGGVVHNLSAGIGIFVFSDNNAAVVTGVGSRWENKGELDVGVSGAGNQLMVSNGAVVRSFSGYLGFTDTSGGNVAVVTGVGSLWTNDSVLLVGADGSGNQMNVRNGGVVRDTIGYIGSNSISGNNTVLVTDAGSLWTNASAIFVGYFGSFNQLVVNNGGKVRVAGPVTLGYGVGSTNNSVLATGGSIASVGLMLGNAASRNNSVTLLSGSVWDVGGGPFIWGNAGNNDTLIIDPTSALTNIGSLTLDEHATPFFLTNAPGGHTLNGFTTNQFQFKTNGLGALIVGYDGTNVQLTISNSTLISTTANIGDNATARSNVVVVTGAGTVWSNSGALNIGNFGSFSRLVVRNGGAVRAGGLITLGKTANSTNNSVLAVNGSLSSVGLTLGNVQSRNNSITLLSGSTWDAGGGTFTWGNAGINDTLTIDVTSSLTNIGALTLDENNTANLLTNSSSLNGMKVGFKTSGLGALVVGNAGSNVALTISNFNWAGTSGDIGFGATSQSNSVFLSGVSSAWSNTGNLFVGNGGAFNSLVISAGAVAASASGTVGNNATAISNSVLVAGAGSVWSNSGPLTIGNSGAFNRLVISNAAKVSASNVVVGFNSSASNNFLLLSTGAQLTNGGDGVLGWNTGANANSAFVTGTNSRWLVGNSLYVGSNGAFNQLVISNAGTLIAGPNLSVFTGGGVFVGANPGASNNLLSLSSGAQMTNGGYVALGWSLGANSNTVSVSGPNTRWQMLPYAYLYVGNSGSFNRLVISNGAQVKQTGNTVVNIGFNFSAINNEVVVTGTNSLWTMSELTVGLFGGGSHLVISDGARVESDAGWIGPSNASPPSPVSNNVALVTGANSRWTMSSGLVVGNSGSGSLVISNGGGVNNFAGIIGTGIYGNNNRAVVTGANSYWSNAVSLYVGQAGSGCSLVISNGAWVDDTAGIIGLQTVGETNEVVVTGAGSVWNNRDEVRVGSDGNWNRLAITAGGTVFAANRVYVGFGFNPVSSNNLLTVSGGSLIVTNLAGSAFLDVRFGTNVLNAGLIEADRLLLTNASVRGGGWFNFNGGTLKTRTTTNNNGRLFAVGNGASTAVFELAGNGLHTFTDGLAISNNGTLRGNGSINGTLAVAVGGTLSPGTSVGKIVLNNSPVLLGNVIMEISRNGAVLTNDQVQVAGTLTYGGSLTVNNVGPGTLTTGNSFQLFSASGYGGAFTTVNLPALNGGLSWTNKLLVNGSIEVIGVALPQFEKIGVSGTNLIVSGTNGVAGTNYAVLTATNIALPLSNWVSLSTNQFGAGGGFSFTNGIAPGESQRYFRLRTP